MASRVLITGMGAISPHGRGVDALWAGLLSGRSAFKTISLFDASCFRNATAGEVAGYDADPQGKEKPRAFRMLLDACAQALAEALGIEAQGTHQKIAEAAGQADGFQQMGLVAGTNFGGMSAAERALFAAEDAPKDANLNPYLFGTASEDVARTFGLTGPRLNVSLACASGAAAIGLGTDLIRQGRAEAVLACGYDELSMFIFAGLSALRAITPDTIRPFDKRRKGTLFSEGAGAVLLESESRVKRRGGRALAEVRGRFMNNDAYHMTAPEQEAQGIKKLMREALRDSGCQADEIDHLNLHATGTPYNDKIETKAVLDVFGERGKEIPVCSIKSSIGHTMGGAGVLESIAAVKTLEAGMVPPVLGLDADQQDPECGLNAPTGAPLKGEYRTILKTSYGFGGTNAAIVLSKADGLEG